MQSERAVDGKQQQQFHELHGLALFPVKYAISSQSPPNDRVISSLASSSSHSALLPRLYFPSTTDNQAMPPTTSSHITNTASLILERTRVVSLGLTPSPATDTKIVRALRQVRDELAARDGEDCEDEWKRWGDLVAMMKEDEVGRKQVAGLERPVKVMP